MKGSKLPLLCMFILGITTLFAAAGCGGNGSSNAGSGSQPTTPLGTTSTTNIPTLEEERPAVNAKVNALSQALIKKDIDQAVLLCSPENRDRYREMFQSTPSALPKLGESLQTAALVFVSPGFDRYGDRFGGLSVIASGVTTHINIVKINDVWYFQDL